MKNKRDWRIILAISATVKKLGVNFYHYISERISGAFEMPGMAELITQKAQQQNLGAPWNPPKITSKNFYILVFSFCILNLEGAPPKYIVPCHILRFPLFIELLRYHESMDAGKTVSFKRAQFLSQALAPADYAMGKGKRNIEEGSLWIITSTFWWLMTAG